MALAATAPRPRDTCAFRSSSYVKTEGPRLVLAAKSNAAMTSSWCPMSFSLFITASTAPLDTPPFLSCEALSSFTRSSRFAPRPFRAQLIVMSSMFLTEILMPTPMASSAARTTSAGNTISPAESAARTSPTASPVNAALLASAPAASLSLHASQTRRASAWSFSRARRRRIRPVCLLKRPLETHFECKSKMSLVSQTSKAVAMARSRSAASGDTPYSAIRAITVSIAPPPLLLRASSDRTPENVAACGSKPSACIWVRSALDSSIRPRETRGLMTLSNVARSASTSNRFIRSTARVMLSRSSSFAYTSSTALNTDRSGRIRKSRMC